MRRERVRRRRGGRCRVALEAVESERRTEELTLAADWVHITRQVALR